MKTIVFLIVTMGIKNGLSTSGVGYGAIEVVPVPNMVVCQQMVQDVKRQVRSTDNLDRMNAPEVIATCKAYEVE